jgi:hypothetical protein
MLAVVMRVVVAVAALTAVAGVVATISNPRRTDAT